MEAFFNPFLFAILGLALGLYIGHILGVRDGMKAQAKQIAEGEKVVVKKKVLDLRKLNYRVIERKCGNGTVWVAQHRTPDCRWKDCKDKYGKWVRRTTANAARHWFFWEDGANQFPDAGTDGQEVCKYRANGTRIPEDDEYSVQEEA